MSNLSQVARARRAAKLAGVRTVQRGTGNETYLHFYWPSGRRCKVWYPEDGRVADRDERELEYVITTLQEGLPC